MIGDTISVRNIGKFRYFCQKILPAVYDDSLSYYELLNKVVWYLNTVIDEVNVHSDAIKELQEELQNFIDGNFDDIIEEKVEQWFEENEPSIMAAIEELQNRVTDIENNEEYTYFNNSITNNDNKSTLQIAAFDGQPIFLVNQTASNSIDDVAFEDKTFKEVFEDDNIIEYDNSTYSWDTGDATLSGNVVITEEENNIPTLDFNTLQSGSNCSIIFPQRTFLEGHVYILLGQYNTTTYNGGFYGVRSINRFMFDGVCDNIYHTFLHVICHPDADDESDYPLPSNLSNVLNVGVFYDAYALTQPYIHTKVRLLTLIDITEYTTSITNIKKAFDKYVGIKTNKNQQKYYVKLNNLRYYTDYDLKTFIRMMRYRAYSLGATSSHWFTSNGLPANNSISQASDVNYGTVVDLMRVGLGAFSNNVLQNILSRNNTILNIYGNTSLTMSEFRNYNTSDYPYSVMVNENLKALESPSISMPYDILGFKGGSLGASGNEMPWTYATPNVGIFRSYVGTTEFINNQTLLYVIHGYKGSPNVHRDIVYAIQQYMLQMNINDGVPLTEEQEAALALGQPLYAALKALESDENQPIAWGAMVLPNNSYLYTSLTNEQLFEDNISDTPIHLHHFVNESKLYPFASTTKLLTCLLVCESGIDLTEQFSIVSSDITIGSGTVLRPDMKINCRDLMYLALWNSDNDSCNALGRIIGHEFTQNYNNQTIVKFQ